MIALLISMSMALASPSFTCIPSTGENGEPVVECDVSGYEAVLAPAQPSAQDWKVVGVVSGGTVDVACPLGEGAQIRQNSLGQVEVRALEWAETECVISEGETFVAAIYVGDNAGMFHW